MRLRNRPQIRIALFVLCALAGRYLAIQGAEAQAVTSPTAVVYCYDRERDVVSRELRGACHGAIVDQAAAEAIKARRDEALARTLGKPAQEAPEGRHLASLGT